MLKIKWLQKAEAYAAINVSQILASLKFKNKIRVEKEEERRDKENWAGKIASLPPLPQVILVCGLFGSRYLQKRNATK